MVSLRTRIDWPPIASTFVRKSLYGIVLPARAGFVKRPKANGKLCLLQQQAHSLDEGEQE
eukprot:COSAG06_NODE_49767_length_323_cov_0.691964_1_plen_59_part_10